MIYKIFSALHSIVLSTSFALPLSLAQAAEISQAPEVTLPKFAVIDIGFIKANPESPLDLQTTYLCRQRIPFTSEYSPNVVSAGVTCMGTHNGRPVEVSANILTGPRVQEREFDGKTYQTRSFKVYLAVNLIPLGTGPTIQHYEVSLGSTNLTQNGYVLDLQPAALSDLFVCVQKESIEAKSCIQSIGEVFVAAVYFE